MGLQLFIFQLILKQFPIRRSVRIPNDRWLTDSIYLNVQSSCCIDSSEKSNKK